MTDEQPTVDARLLLGKRILARLVSGYRTAYSQVREYRLLEVSPSGLWTKLMDDNGRKFWVSTTDVSMVELLVDLRAERMTDKPEDGEA
jgi:hypothetical protein